MKILEAARAVIDGAIAVLTFARKFVTDNTPESALVIALYVDYQGYTSGALPLGAAVLAAFTALTTFMVTESAKDGKTIQAVASQTGGTVPKV